MKIIIFTENNRGGGMDTFIGSLINNWPEKNDTFMVICNKNHPGLSYLEGLLPKNTQLIKHSIKLNWSIAAKIISKLPMLFQRIIRQLLRILLAPVQYVQIKNLLSKHDGDQLISVNGSYPGGETCRLANIAWRSIGKPRSIHNLHNYATKNRKIFSFYESFIDGKLEDSCKNIISVSKSCANSLRVRDKFKYSNKISYIYNGLDIKLNNTVANNLRETIGISKNSKLMVMIGTYEERKGHEFLLKAMSYVYQKHINVHLAIIGSGSKSETSRVNQLIEKHTPNKNVHLTGFIDNAPQMIKGADILLIPSQSFESFGLTAVEGMLNSIPVISTDTGGLPETLGENGVTGLYSSANNYELFSKNIIYLLDNKGLRKEIGLNGKLRAENLFSPSMMAKKYKDLI
jgi:L-malate glycosyltransferase